MSIFFSFLSTLVIIFIVPIIIYGLFTYFFKLKEPDKKLKFFLGVLIEKIGTAFGFVILFYLGKEIFIDKWFEYSIIWFVMFAITEIGQTYLNDSSKKEALAGIISEVIYFSLSSYIIALILA